MNIEQFFKAVEERAISLREAQRGQRRERLQLAREFIGTGSARILQLLEDAERTDTRLLPRENPRGESVADDEKFNMGKVKPDCGYCGCEQPAC